MKSNVIRSSDLNGHTLAATARAEAQRYEHLRARLVAEVPDIDAETLADTLEGITDLHEALAEVVRSALDDEAVATGLAARLGDMRQRLDRLETRGKRKRQLVLQILKEAGIDKLNAPDFTAGLRQSAPALGGTRQGLVSDAVLQLLARLVAGASELIDSWRIEDEALG